MDQRVVEDEFMPSQSVRVNFEVRPDGHSQVDHHDEERLLEGREPPFLLQDGQQEPYCDGLTSLAKEQQVQRSCEFVLGRPISDIVGQKMLQLVSGGVFVLTNDGLTEVHNKMNQY